MNRQDAQKKLEEWFEQNGERGKVAVSISRPIGEFPEPGWQFEIVLPIPGTYNVFPEGDPIKVG